MNLLRELEKHGFEPWYVIFIFCLLLLFTELRKIKFYKKFTASDKFKFYTLILSSLAGIIFFFYRVF